MGRSGALLGRPWSCPIWRQACSRERERDQRGEEGVIRYVGRGASVWDAKGREGAAGSREHARHRQLAIEIET